MEKPCRALVLLTLVFNTFSKEMVFVFGKLQMGFFRVLICDYLTSAVEDLTRRLQGFLLYGFI